MPDLPRDHPLFVAAYLHASGQAELPAQPDATGTIGAAIIAFRRSDRYLAAAPATRSVWRRGLDDMRRRYGKAKLADLQPRHIRLDLARLDPHPANARLKVWRAFCGWCFDKGLADGDPAADVAKPDLPPSDGHEPWTVADVDAFRDHWPIGTRERTAFEILYWTGARISDAVSLTRTMIDADGWLSYRQGKTKKSRSGGAVDIPWSDLAPEWANPEQQTVLLETIEDMPDRHITLITTAYGAPRSVKSSSAWFASAALAAGVVSSRRNRKDGSPVGKGAHGIRKLRAAQLKENGATADQRKGWLGHESDSEEARYSASADRRKVISGTERHNSPIKGTTHPKIVHRNKGLAR